MKSQEQRIKDVATVLREHAYVGLETGRTYRFVAKLVLEAADAEPKWPSDETIVQLRNCLGYLGSSLEERRESVRDVLKRDPIIQAVIAYRDKWQRLGYPAEAKDVVAAINDAGL